MVPVIRAVLAYSNPHGSSTVTFKAVNGAETAMCIAMKYGSTALALDMCLPLNSTVGGIAYHYEPTQEERGMGLLLDVW